MERQDIAKGVNTTAIEIVLSARQALRQPAKISLNL